MSKKCILTAKFRECMYKNMWQYMNPDMLTFVLNNNTLMSYKSDIEDDKFGKKYANTICFKGSETEGHYVYISKALEALGTYECDMLSRDDDDGICHGASVAFYLNANYKQFGKFKLIPYPSGVEEYRHNYYTILNVYLYLIDSGMWDNALKEFFYHDVHWIGNTTHETQRARKCLVEYMPRFV